MSVVLARSKEMGLEPPAGRSAGQRVVVDAASSLLVLLFDDGGGHACLMAGSPVEVEELAFGIVVEMVAEVMRP